MVVGSLCGFSAQETSAFGLFFCQIDTPASWLTDQASAALKGAAECAEPLEVDAKLYSTSWSRALQRPTACLGWAAVRYGPGAWLTEVQVDSGPQGTAVTLVGLSNPIYTAVYDADLEAVVIEHEQLDPAGRVRGGRRER